MVLLVVGGIWCEEEWTIGGEMWWLEEEEEDNFYNMLVEFGQVEDSTDDDWDGWLSFMEEFEGVLDFLIEEAEDFDWDAEMVGRYFDGA